MNIVSYKGKATRKITSYKIIKISLAFTWSDSFQQSLTKCSWFSSLTINQTNMLKEEYQEDHFTPNLFMQSDLTDDEK